MDEPVCEPTSESTATELRQRGYPSAKCMHYDYVDDVCYKCKEGFDSSTDAIVIEPNIYHVWCAQQMVIPFSHMFSRIKRRGRQAHKSRKLKKSKKSKKSKKHSRRRKHRVY
jgi:hypothetical protein